MGWFRSERVTWAERAVWAGLVLGSVAPLVLQPEPEAAALAYLEAVNRGDVDAALDLTSTDFVVRPLGGGYYYRGEMARPVFEYRELILVVRGSRLILERPRADRKELRRALDPFLAWAAAERPAELARVWVRGELLHRADAARVLVELLEAWRAEGKPGPERNPVAERREGRQP